MQEKYDEVLNYFFFTFVRHPVSRFYSSFLQAYARMPEYQGRTFGPHHNETATAWLTRDPDALTVAMQEILKAQLKNGCMRDHLDEHLESMTMSLSPPLATGAGTPIDYIGDVATLERDFFEMLELAHQHHHHRPMNETERSSPRLLRLRKLLQGPHRDHANERSPALKAAIQRVRTENLDKLVGAVYKQDAVCFGFD